ncbi:hypothetical protein FRC01_004059 [Tulasnella sp. 417]|nr:hypothetical protein FRC01_004059 [Tulasnella sp. 417]
MDAQESIVSDFSFAFKRRSHSPSPHDCLAPATLHRTPSTNGSQSPPPSLSDATSSHGSPKDWNPLSWNPSFSIPDMNLASPPIHWQWQQKQPPSAYLPAVDPMTLTLGEAISLGSEPQYLNPSGLPSEIPSHSTYSLLQALNVLPEATLPADPAFQGGVGYVQPLNAEMAIGPIPSEDSIQDTEAILAAIKASGIHIAALDPNSRDILSSVPIRLPTPPPPKPDLTACPPLAKHLQPTMRPSSTSSPSTYSQGSRPESPCIAEAEPQVIYGASGRPKTSHTTIERRYRTNLNARILALRRAVPALRILEKDENQNPAFPEDVVDERGFVDGVRAARKASKASILGKAAEYIHVLKKREIRLRHEATGLRLLIGSLVGGQALLREFDRTWKDRYGGDEMDDAADLSDEDDDCTDDDDDKPRKKPKITNPKPVPQKKDKKAAETTLETGKRKRGRPKKVQTPDEASPSPSSIQTIPHSSISPSTEHQEESKNLFGAQYLLGAFLFFSFFQSSTDSQLHYPHESHSGSVILPSSPKTTQSLGNVVLTDVSWIRSAAPIVGLFVLMKWAMPWVRRTLSWTSSRAESQKSQISEALAYSDTETSFRSSLLLRKSMDIGGPFTELVRFLLHVNGTSTSRVTDSLETRAWSRLVNLELVHGVSNGTTPNFGTLLALSRCSPRTPPALVALAMVAQSFSSILAQRYWDLARSMILDGSHYPEESMEAVVLKMSVQDAHSLFIKGAQQGLMDVRVDTAALQTIVAVLVLEAFHYLAKAELLRIVNCMASHAGDERAVQHRDSEIEEAMAFVSNTGATIGGPCGELLRLWKLGFHSTPNRPGSPLDALTGAAADTRDLIRVVALLRGIQETGILTPTSSTSSLRETAASPLPRAFGVPYGQRSLSNRLLLRQLLAAPVFESEDTLEDARDSIIDMLYEDRR